MSYGIRDDKYIPVGSTTATLPPGYYGVEEPDFGPPHFVVQSVKTDTLLEVPGTPADDVADDIRKFLARKDEYRKYGFTHKRGYMLYGPPGTGKTSIAYLIAKRFIEDGGVVVVASPLELPLATNMLAKSEPERNLMVLIEDPKEDHLNLGTVLSVLDGTTPVSGLVTVVTTNYKSKMPPRLTNRPGRFDRVVLVDRILPAVQVAFLETIEARHPAGPSVAKPIVEALDGLPLTLAHLKEAFLAHVLLGVSLPDLRERFRRMVDTADTDEGEVAPPAKNPMATLATLFAP